MSLDVDGLEVSYGEAVVILGASLSAGAGKITAVIGPNGAGKTTLLSTIAGLLRQRKGEVRFDSRPIGELPTRSRVKMGIVLCPERRRLFQNSSVIENIMSGAYLRRDSDRIRSDLGYVYGIFPVLKERASQIAGTLSGGEQQMVAIARSLMSKPRLLMLDEPSLGLSPLMRERIFSAVVEMNRSLSITILLVEQDATEALKIAEYAYVLDGGQISTKGTPGELTSNPEVRKAYLGL